MAGAPFEPLEQLATTKAAAFAREVVVRQKDFARAKTEVERLLQRRGHGLSEELFRAWRKAIRSGTMPPAADGPSSAFAVCWQRAADLATAEAQLKQSLAHELDLARRALLEAAGQLLPPYLVF